MLGKPKMSSVKVILVVSGALCPSRLWIALQESLASLSLWVQTQAPTQLVKATDLFGSQPGPQWQGPPRHPHACRWPKDYCTLNWSEAGLMGGSFHDSLGLGAGAVGHDGDHRRTLSTWLPRWLECTPMPQQFLWRFWKPTCQPPDFCGS